MRKIPALFLFFIATSCLNQANCLFTATNLVKIDFKKLKDNSEDTVTFASIAIVGTPLILTDTTATRLYLPVNPAATETTFLFTYQETVDGVIKNKTSTLTLSYVNEVTLISDECGAFQYQRDLTIASTDFVKSQLINSSLLTGVPSNVEIYF